MSSKERPQKETFVVRVPASWLPHLTGMSDAIRLLLGTLVPKEDR